MLVELHLLQNFAPSNLNRDDTGSPKECEFGGYRRARISSQCFKRAIRMRFKTMLAENETATRSRLVVEQKVLPILVELDHEREQARAVVERALSAVKLAVDKEGKTEYLLFLSPSEIARFADVCHRNFDVLLKAASKETTSKEAGGKRTKKEARAEVPAEVRSAVEAIFDGGKAADLALFGRMLADLPEKNIDAAAQVAHAISTNRVSPEFDYFTAVDDLNPKEQTGAGMLGTVEFNSACFYRYSNVDLAQLTANLKNDPDLARRTLESFIRSTVDAVPSGKQNSMAAHNPPSFILAVVRESGPWSLANAFLNPVRPDSDGDLVKNSIRQLDQYWGSLIRMYGSKGIKSTQFTTLEPCDLKHLGKSLDNLEKVVENVMSAAQF
jgi:CRISPR system Cascade subunit CasC